MAAKKPTGYDTDITLFATRYKQGGRTVYGLDLSPEQIVNFIPAPDPSVKTPGNREIRPKHASSFARYFREQAQWVVPGMILRTAAPFQFEVQVKVAGTEFGILTFPRMNLLDLYILDGQHRILGFHMAFQQIGADLDKARSQKATARKVDPDSVAVAMAEDQIAELETQRKRLSNERVSLEIFVVQDPAEYKQMFFDVADNALGITSSVKSRFDNRRVVNRSLEMVMEHPLLDGRVDQEADRIGKGSPYLLGAKHVAEIIRSVRVGLLGRVSRVQDKTWSETDLAVHAKEFIDILVAAFPPLKAVELGQILPDGLRKTSMLGSPTMLRILAGAYHELVSDLHHFTPEMVGEFFASKLAPHMEAPVYPGSIWLDKFPVVFTDGSGNPGGRRQDLSFVKDAIVDWAIEKPDFLDAPPKPRPEPEPEIPIEEMTEEQLDAELRPEIAKAKAKVGASKR